MTAAESDAADTPGCEDTFADGPGMLFIVSCLTDACPSVAKVATFEVHPCVEPAPDPLPDGVDLIDG